MPAPRISVVIPTHNHASFLPTAIGSVRSQGWHGIEIIVVDDGSTDDTARVLAELAGDDLRVRRQPKSGAAAARNRGIEESRGDWVAFLDADDYWLPGKLDAQVRALETGRVGCAFAYCGSLVFDERGDTIEERPAAPAPTLLDGLVWGNTLTTASIMVRRSALFEVGLFDESLNVLGEDWDLWLRLGARYEGACVPEPLAAIRYRFFHDRYLVRSFETATRRVISRLFESLRDRRDLAHIIRQKGTITSWHHSVIAKNYLECGEVSDFLRCAALCIAAHPVRGWYYLTPSRVLGVRVKGEPALGRK